MPTINCVPSDLLQFLERPERRHLRLGPGGEVQSVELFAPAELTEQAFTFYETWDCDHHTVTVYPGADWDAVLRNVHAYFNGGWAHDRVAHRYLRPEEGYEFNPRPDSLRDHPRLPGF